MRKPDISITFEVWITFPEEIQKRLFMRIVGKYHEVPPPIDRMMGVELFNCVIPIIKSPSKYNLYGKTSTSFKEYKGETFRYTPHQIIWWWFYGDTGEKIVQHKCGVHRCIQPHHLMLDIHRVNSEHASATRKPGDIVEGLRSWKTCPLDIMICMYLRSTFGASHKFIGKLIGTDKTWAAKKIRQVLNRKSILITKDWEKEYVPPTRNELTSWVKLLLSRIKHDEELKHFFTPKILQHMFCWAVDFERCISWYYMTMKKL